MKSFDQIIIIRCADDACPSTKVPFNHFNHLRFLQITHLPNLVGSTYRHCNHYQHTLFLQCSECNPILGIAIILQFNRRKKSKHQQINGRHKFALFSQHSVLKCSTFFLAFSQHSFHLKIQTFFMNPYTFALHEWNSKFIDFSDWKPNLRINIARSIVFRMEFS